MNVLIELIARSMQNMKVVHKSQGYIILWRSVLDSPIWDNPKLERIYHWIMLRANWQQTEVIPFSEKITLLPGQFITSYPHAKAKLKMSVGSINTYLKLLQSEKIIEIKSTTKYTVITVLNWGDLQNPERKNEIKQNVERKHTETDNTVNTVNTDNTVNTTTQEALIKIEKTLGNKYAYKDGKPYFLKGGYLELIGNPVAFAASLPDPGSDDSNKKINPILIDPDFITYSKVYLGKGDASVRQKMSLEPLLSSRYPHDKYGEQWKEAMATLRK